MDGDALPKYTFRPFSNTNDDAKIDQTCCPYLLHPAFAVSRTASSALEFVPCISGAVTSPGCDSTTFHFHDNFEEAQYLHKSNYGYRWHSINRFCSHYDLQCNYSRGYLRQIYEPVSISRCYDRQTPKLHRISAQRIAKKENHLLF